MKTKMDIDLFNELTKAGAPRPADSSPLWNDWAAKNPQPAALAMAKLDIVEPLIATMKGIATGARPIEL
jgi:hypothetical protein